MADQNAYDFVIVGGGTAGMFNSTHFRGMKQSCLNELHNQAVHLRPASISSPRPNLLSYSSVAPMSASTPM